MSGLLGTQSASYEKAITPPNKLTAAELREDLKLAENWLQSLKNEAVRRAALKETTDER